MTSPWTKAPTLLVLAAAGLAAWPLLSRERSRELGGGTRPPEAERRPAPDLAASTRNPFRADWMARPTPAPRPTLAASKAEVLKVATAGASPGAAGPGAPGAPSRPREADPALDGLRLGGTLVVGREQLAVIGGKVYARGERLRARDGSPLPYVVSEVRKDRAVLARGDRRVVLGFADPARAPADGPRATDPRPSPTQAPAPVPAPAPSGTIAARDPAPARGPMLDPIRRALGMASGPGLDAGLDALTGRLDGIGRAGEGGGRP